MHWNCSPWACPLRILRVCAVCLSIVPLLSCALGFGYSDTYEQRPCAPQHVENVEISIQCKPLNEGYYDFLCRPWVPKIWLGLFTTDGPHILKWYALHLMDDQTLSVREIRLIGPSASPEVLFPGPFDLVESRNQMELDHPLDLESVGREVTVEIDLDLTGDGEEISQTLAFELERSRLAIPLIPVPTMLMQPWDPNFLWPAGLFSDEIRAAPERPSH